MKSEQEGMVAGPAPDPLNALSMYYSVTVLKNTSISIVDRTEHGIILGLLCG